MSSIVVSETSRVIHNFDQLTGQPIELGRIISRVYEGEQVQRHEFHSNATGPGKKVFRLGPTTTQFRFVDHTTAIQPFLDAGYRITRSVPIRGGLQIWTELQPIEPVLFPDIVEWDAQFWRGADQVRGHGLNETVVIVSATRPKKAISYRRGWFRQICTNGMVAEVLGLGNIRLSHTQFTIDKVRAFIQTTGPRIDAIGRDSDRLLGPWVGTRKGAERLSNVMRQYMIPGAREVSNDDEADDEEESEDVHDFVQNVPLFIRDAVKPLARQPRWYLADLALQFQAIAENKREDKVYALDVVNALTNPITRVPDRRSNVRPLWAQQPLSKSVIQLIGGMSLS